MIIKQVSSANDKFEDVNNSNFIKILMSDIIRVLNINDNNILNFIIDI